MRLLTLTIRNFRGFGAIAESIRLDGNLILFFGPNGFGKTSIAEAIEWLFYGTTKRRQRGDTYSRSEYAGTFANVHGGQPVEVEALVQFNGTTVRLCRRMTTDESSETLIEGVLAPFTALLNPLEAVYPVIAQHGLQTFIHAKPKDRRDAICAALGLDELTSLKSALDSARTSFQRTPPRVVTQARRELMENAAVLAQIDATAPLAARWRRTPPQVNVAADTAALLQASAVLAGTSCSTVDEALEALRAQRLIASRAVFDSSKLSPPDDAAAIRTALGSKSQVVLQSLATVERLIAAAIAAIVSAYPTVLLEFWSKGLELADDSAECPMCDATTLSERRKNELRSRLAAATRSMASHKAMVDAIDRAKVQLAEVKEAIDHLGISQLQSGDREHLSRMYVEQPDSLNTLLSRYDRFDEARHAILAEIASTTDFLSHCTTRLSDPANASTVNSEAASAKDRPAEPLSASLDAYDAYVEGWAAFEPSLSSRIASDKVVAKIDAVGKTLRKLSHMRVLYRYDHVLTEAQELIRSVEAEIQLQQGALLTTRGTEVKDLYDRLNRGANVGFDTMEPGTDSMKLHASSFGIRMSAAANLSECQLNCVGLAMWLMRATTPSSPFGFVLLDDPVQSMDDDHTEAFISDVVPHLMDHHGKATPLRLLQAWCTRLSK